ncbi:type II toxin-antitoxin system RelE/ParE family toxin [Luteimonas soli]|uniref:Type II toxin-antitoxin system RelE/ParE family toxin n=1 Tax=Luteimonas soli TaxID=1648966 RepID=A0ABV7XK38_9GAMM
MSNASRGAAPTAPDRTERTHAWIAALASALWHALLLLLLVLSPPITVTAPEAGGAAGSRLQVTYIDDALRPPSPAPVPNPRPEPPRERPAPARPASRVQATPVEQADDSPALQVVDIPATPPEPESPPSDVPEPAAQRPAHVWGQPPGMLPEDLAPANAGLARSPGTNRGRRNDTAASGTSLEVGGYQVYYDLLDETRLRAWHDEGMTELFLPLPGTQRLMVCPLETALHRESGACRLVEPDDPELAAIGDARDVITMHRVYRLGEVLWSGPGAYR